ncbi:SIR2 family protein [Pleomorphomonas carboxyditropha]|uniref:NAD(+) hydrolase ThsA n=1 Tax=Pleomorphomonas carboxyditropha TaxID=2023338 RepID=A0A2G9WRT0_9HYPH|nr:SIR2 family protein [Pleomorphomonas carboxyditropha]PIO97032.1 hypothetical protein CJ014_22290 [Pleomorphomonas carboxyditropha]
MPLSSDVTAFCRKFAKELAEGTAAIFAGAGLSASAGFVNWRQLLEPFATELGLSVDKESDHLVRFAQYSQNYKGGNRAHLNEALITAFPSLASPAINHQILARLPIQTFWTTNYDKLIETALVDARKTPDVKHTDSQLPITKPKRDAVVYKMHGDVDRPQEAVLTRDDYEAYAQKHIGFVNALVGDLTGKTFLFIGFSFSDPNLDQVLTQLRLRYQSGQREHYCFVRIPDSNDFKNNEDFIYAKARHRHFVNDLKRYNVTTLEISDYSEITEALSAIERLYRRRLIFVSGSASDFAPWGESAVNAFFRDLGAILIDNDFQIVTGFGLGVGNSLISGAIEKAYSRKNLRLDNFLQVRPFPRDIADPMQRAVIWKKYREELLSLPGIALFLFGNKLENDQIVPADGVRKEFEIARMQGVEVLPVGATGSMAATLAVEILKEPSGLSPTVIDALTRLNEKVTDIKMLLQPITDALKALAAE